MRHVLLVAAGFGALLVLALGANASHTNSARTRSADLPIGLVPPHIGAKQVGHFKSSRPGLEGQEVAGLDSSSFHPSTKKDNLTNGTGPDQIGVGPVMRTNTVYAIYWVPSGGAYSLPSNYQSTIDQYFTDVAHDSGADTNVYSAATQYSDDTGAIAYNSTFAGSAVDTNAFPSSDCTTPSDVLDTTVCMSDDALQAEVKAFVDSKGWTANSTTEFFLFTPQNVETCFYTDAEAVDQGGNICSYDYYCAYHSHFDNGGEYIYANMSFPNQTVEFGGTDYASDCDSGEHPNGDGTADPNDTNAADEVLSVTSHEHNESITDPLGTAWYDDNPSDVYWYGSENGDLCAWSWQYSPKSYFGLLGGDMAEGTGYNQSINGDHYFLQGEWSNAAATTGGWSGCVWDTVSKKTKATLDSFAPSGGPAGSTVTIDGSNFLTAKSVKFNGKPAPFDIQSDGEITATVPDGANTGKISVQTSAGTVVSAYLFNVLQIKSFAPPKGESGTVVTINGSDFARVTEVDFNGTPGDTLHVVSDTKLTVDAPVAGTSGTISMTGPDGTATSAKEFVYVPAIASFSPEVKAIGGTVTIVGTSFTGATSVRFGSKSTTNFTVDTDSQITATVPDGATTGKVAVVTPGGTATSTDTFTPVAIKSLSPRRGAVGTLVTIIGTGFTGATAVDFNGIGGTNLSVVNDKKITVQAACGSLGAKTVTVVTPNGTAIAPQQYTLTGTGCT